jgi:hypothetical protein
MLASKAINISTSKLYNKLISEVPTHLSSIRKIMEAKKICRNGVLVVSGGSLTNININKYEVTNEK